MGLGQSALFAKARPLGVDEEAGTKFGGNGRGLVLTARVQNDDLVHQSVEGGEALAQVVGFILDNQNGGQSRFFHEMGLTVIARLAGRMRIDGPF